MWFGGGGLERGSEICRGRKASPAAVVVIGVWWRIGMRILIATGGCSWGWIDVDIVLGIGGLRNAFYILGGRCVKWLDWEVRTWNIWDGAVQAKSVQFNSACLSWS